MVAVVQCKLFALLVILDVALLSFGIQYAAPIIMHMIVAILPWGVISYFWTFKIIIMGEGKDDLQKYRASTFPWVCFALANIAACGILMYIEEIMSN